MAARNPDVFLRQVTRRIAAVRKTKGLTQEGVAERLHMAMKNYQRIEYGQNITLRMLARVANALSVSPADLIDEPRPK
ncbi:MAG: helix-turn-helix transcriptional regulator [Polyangia bacterium]